ncbi:YlxR family protein [Desulfurobacterium sp.]
MSDMPERTCAGCRKKGEKEEFIRFVMFDGKPFPDIKGTLPGRGFNVCPRKDCIKKFVKKQFKEKISHEAVVEETLKQLKNYLLSLLSVAHKSRITIVGQDNIKKMKPEEGTLFISKNLSRKTAENLKRYGTTVIDGIFSSEEIGNALKKETEIGTVFVKPLGIGKKIEITGKKLKSLLE